MISYRATHRRQVFTALKMGNRRQVSALEADLRQPGTLDAAIRQEQLRLFYHPIVHLADAAVFGHEVLIRWQHPEHGLLSPAEFLPHIEAEATLSRDLGTWVLQQACGSAMKRGDNLYLGVNISPLHLAMPDFADQLLGILHATGFSAASLIIDITEASVRQADARVVNTCRALTDAGVALALDDFGIGQHSDAFLDTLPLGILKIDRTVITGIGTSTADEQLIVNILELAKRTDRRTIAEGVETHEQAHFLSDHGATYAQGYLYGRPKPH